MEGAIFSGEKPSSGSRGKRMIPIVAVAVLILCVVIALLILWPKIAPGESPAAFRQGYTEYAGVIRKGNPDYDIYLKHLFILSAQGMVSENLLGQKVALVSGRLRNQGAQTLDVVEIEITLTDLDGKPIRRFLRTPVKPERPVLPSEVRNFSVTLSPYPPEWTRAVVQTEIHGFRYKH
ncbi:MAG: hypothetical protein KA419_00780 [Acidobacteria bacterium]|nr:hypothetical protein [Acidobacteriota bacterium]